MFVNEYRESAAQGFPVLGGPPVSRLSILSRYQVASRCISSRGVAPFRRWLGSEFVERQPPKTAGATVSRPRPRRKEKRAPRLGRSKVQRTRLVRWFTTDTRGRQTKNPPPESTAPWASIREGKAQRSRVLRSTATPFRPRYKIHPSRSHNANKLNLPCASTRGTRPEGKRKLMRAALKANKMKLAFSFKLIITFSHGRRKEDRRVQGCWNGAPISNNFKQRRNDATLDARVRGGREVVESTIIARFVRVSRPVVVVIEIVPGKTLKRAVFTANNEEVDPRGSWGNRGRGWCMR